MSKDRMLYIDGVLMDVDDGTTISLDIKSNLFIDVDNMVSNRTYTVKIPKTIHNMTVLGRADIPKSETKSPYIFHVCRYLVGGVIIIPNGRVSVNSVNETIELTIYWGIFPNLQKLQEDETKLNELKTDEHVLYSRRNESDSYSDAKKKGIFYAQYNAFRKSENADEWTGRDDVVTNDSATLTRAGGFGNRDDSTSGSGSSSGIFGSVTAGDNPIQPCVTCHWILSLIKSSTDVDFRFPKDAIRYFKTLAVPLISRKADEQTITGSLKATFEERTTLGLLGFSIAASTTSFKQQDGESATQLDVVTACELEFSVVMYWSWDASAAKPQGSRSWVDDDGIEHTEGYYSYYGNYIEVKVVSKHDESETDESKYTAYYYVGRAQRDSQGNISDATITDLESNKVDGRFTHRLSGEGKISLEAGDIVTFTMANQKGTLRGLRCYDGTIKASLSDSDEVPYGGMFPIGKNLPDMNVLDFIKCLCLLTGTFPRQASTSGSIEFVRFGEVWDNRGKAVDWTRKLIAREEWNIPHNMEFSIGNYCRRNHYKWTDDETVDGDYSADLVIDNETLEYEQDVWTIPFAASDGNRIPIFEARDSSASNDRTAATQSDKYNACKDRLMTLYSNEGRAALRFDIDLNKIFEDKYSDITSTISRAHVLKEWMNLTEVDIMQFDEAIPIYLAQYGAYFAVTELKVTDGGYTEVTMIQIDFN